MPGMNWMEGLAQTATAWLQGRQAADAARAQAAQVQFENRMKSKQQTLEENHWAAQVAAANAAGQATAAYREQTYKLEQKKFAEAQRANKAKEDAGSPAGIAAAAQAKLSGELAAVDAVNSKTAWQNARPNPWSPTPLAIQNLDAPPSGLVSMSGPTPAPLSMAGSGQLPGYAQPAAKSILAPVASAPTSIMSPMPATPPASQFQPQTFHPATPLELVNMGMEPDSRGVYVQKYSQADMDTKSATTLTAKYNAEMGETNARYQPYFNDAKFNEYGQQAILNAVKIASETYDMKVKTGVPIQLAINAAEAKFKEAISSAKLTASQADFAVNSFSLRLNALKLSNQGKVADTANTWSTIADRAERTKLYASSVESTIATQLYNRTPALQTMTGEQNAKQLANVFTPILEYQRLASAAVPGGRSTPALAPYITAAENAMEGVDWSRVTPKTRDRLTSMLADLKAKADEEGVTIGVVPQAGTVGPTTGGDPPQGAPRGAHPVSVANHMGQPAQVGQYKGFPTYRTTVHNTGASVDVVNTPPIEAILSGRVPSEPGLCAVTVKAAYGLHFKANANQVGAGLYEYGYRVIPSNQWHLGDIVMFRHLNHDTTKDGYRFGHLAILTADSHGRPGFVGNNEGSADFWYLTGHNGIRAEFRMPNNMVVFHKEINPDF